MTSAGLLPADESASSPAAKAWIRNGTRARIMRASDIGSRPCSWAPPSPTVLTISTTRSGRSSRKTPIVIVSAGRRRTMSRTVGRRDLPRTPRREHEAERVGAHGHREERVLLRGDATDLHEHDGDGTGSGARHPAITLTPPRSTGRGDPDQRRDDASESGGAHVPGSAARARGRRLRRRERDRRRRRRLRPTATGCWCGRSAWWSSSAGATRNPVLRTLFDWLPAARDPRRVRPRALARRVADRAGAPRADDLVRRAHRLRHGVDRATAGRVLRRAAPALVRLRAPRRVLEPLRHRDHGRRVRVLRRPGSVRAVRLHVPRVQPRRLRDLRDLSRRSRRGWRASRVRCRTRTEPST